MAAGAISKANANDPKKSALVRCARTDKGVHAAGNVVSLKLIDEDADLVAKINAALSPQIRVWGIQRTVGSFSCYQACDSRWYEYLLPTHAFLPPHPASFLGRRLEELADEVGDREGYEGRQEEVRDWWKEADETYIKPVLNGLDDKLRAEVLQALYDPDEAEDSAAATGNAEEMHKSIAEDLQQHPSLKPDHPPTTTGADPPLSDNAEPITDTATATREAPPISSTTTTSSTLPSHTPAPPEVIEHRKALDAAVKSLRAAYIAAKRSYRISPARLARVSAALSLFVGTRNFHNYTVTKSFSDPSARRVIRSFAAAAAPQLASPAGTSDGGGGGSDGGASSTTTTTPTTATTEWLSLRVHGQSFMMHQIRKMVGMLSLCIRCGTDPSVRIPQSFGDVKLVIPKAPGLGLLLERPVFDSYNEGAATRFEREGIDFTRYETEMEEFKQREIYTRIFREEDAGNVFHTFFAHVDGLKEAEFLWLSSKGVDAVRNLKKQPRAGRRKVELESDDEDAAWGKEEG